MKISEFIEYLESIKSEHGDIDTICVTPGYATAWETAIPTEDANYVEKTSGFYKRHHNIKSDVFLFIGIDG